MKSSMILRAITTMVLLLVGAAYHDYSGCRVNCRYCPPKPLAYSHYCGCQCHSCAASKYLMPKLESFEQPSQEVVLENTEEE